jgi:hypothetical protein
MKLEEINLWMLDTISEGGYCVRELYEYITSNNVRRDDFLNALQSLYSNNLIVLNFSVLRQDSSEASISRKKLELQSLDSVLRQNLSGASRDVVDLSQDGRFLLQKMGVGYPDDSA